MPRTSRKSKVPQNPNFIKNSSAFPAEVVSLAAEYGIDPAALLDWKVYPSGKVVLIAPNGMKLVREMGDPELLQPAIENHQVTPVDASVAADGTVIGGAHGG